MNFRFGKDFATAGLVVAAWLMTACAAETGLSIDPQKMQKHIEFLASDELEGRGPGTNGIEKAADYIAAQFKEVGLEPGGVDGTYFQPFPIALERKLDKGNRLKLSGVDRELVQGKDFIPLSFSGSGEFSGHVVFCGYGIANPDKNHDDFQQLDLKGRIVLVGDGEPAGWADKEGNPTPHSYRRNKVYNAKDRGAAAILFMNQEPAPGEKEELTPFRSEGADDYGLASLEISQQLAAELATKSGMGKFKFENGVVRPMELANLTMDGEVKFEKRTATTRNVLGALKGTGAQKDEWIVVGAHYDHLGLRVPMLRTFKDGKLVEGTSVPEIHNGADDNASGTAGLIEIARGMVKGDKPNRSVLFIAFSAEESGLQGSKYYTDHATQPLDRTVAMLNMDMIGRIPDGENRVTVFGANSAAEFPPILEAAGKAGGLTISPGVDSGGRSDHAAFTRKGVPALHYYSGNHSDYHKPSDDTHLINEEGAARIAIVVQETAEALANTDARPKLVEVKVEPKAADPHADPHAALGAADKDKLPTYRVVMGLSPSYAEDGKPGMGVDAVSQDGPADKAGMKAGDRILKIDGKPVANIYDYMASTRNNKGGDTVEVVVLRDGKEVTLKVTLSGTR